MAKDDINCPRCGEFIGDMTDLATCPICGCNLVGNSNEDN